MRNLWDHICKATHRLLELPFAHLLAFWAVTLNTPPFSTLAPNHNLKPLEISEPPNLQGWPLSPPKHITHSPKETSQRAGTVLTFNHPTIDLYYLTCGFIFSIQTTGLLKMGLSCTGRGRGAVAMYGIHPRHLTGPTVLLLRLCVCREKAWRSVGQLLAPEDACRSWISLHSLGCLRAATDGPTF